MNDNPEPIENGQSLNYLIDQQSGKARALAALFDGLSANLTYWDMNAKRMVTVPDHKTRERCATRLLEYGVGKPVERKEIVTTQVRSSEEVQQLFQHSRAMRESLREMALQLGVVSMEEVEPPSHSANDVQKRG
jgi:hypothetical protein